MCTAISFQTKDHYFGRNMDLDHMYPNRIIVSPRNLPFHFRRTADLDHHYAIIGMGFNVENQPLYFDATNEYGLSIAGLNFPEYAVYLSEKSNMHNIAPYELIPWLLGQCKNLSEALSLLEQTNIIKIPFNDKYPLTPLHWLVSDKTGSAVIEPRENGLMVYDNPLGVLTNSPPFDFHLQNLSNYRHLSCYEENSSFCDSFSFSSLSQGTGGVGLPGDLTSQSRFVRAVFTKCNSLTKDSEASSIGQFFHILDTVSQVRGCVRNKNLYEKTAYSSCCNTDKGIYYYTTYENRQITGVQLFRTDLDSSKLLDFPYRTNQQIFMEN